MNIRFCAPSYHREEVETKKYIPFIRVYVDPSEYDSYMKKNPGLDVVKCAEGIQGNLCRVRNYILDQEFENGADVVVLVDDDMKGIFYWEENIAHPVQAHQLLAFIEKYSVVAEELGAKMWGININQDKQVYREYSPFSTLSYLGGPFQAFLKGSEPRYDERLFLKEDYDMTLQQLNKYRKVLRVNKFYYNVKQSTQLGGCATQRNYDVERSQLELLQRKWGSRIVRIDMADRSHNLKKTKSKKRIDYNPIIKVPISGDLNE